MKTKSYKMKSKIIEILNEYVRELETDSYSGIEIHESAFPAIAEKIEALDNWVSVEDRMPDDFDEILQKAENDGWVFHEAQWGRYGYRVRSSIELYNYIKQSLLPKPKTI